MSEGNSTAPISGRLEVQCEERQPGRWVASYPKVGLEATGATEEEARKALVALTQTPESREKLNEFYRSLVASQNNPADKE